MWVVASFIAGLLGNIGPEEDVAESCSHEMQAGISGVQEEEGDGSSQEIEDLVYSFLTIMLEHSMRLKDGWKVGASCAHSWSCMELLYSLLMFSTCPLHLQLQACLR